MTTALWIFPGGKEIDIRDSYKEIKKLQQNLQPKVLQLGVHPLSFPGYENQWRDYAVEVYADRTVVKITHKGKTLPDEVIIMPHIQRMVVIHDIIAGKSLVFGVIYVT
jgi:hypothetical protein